eukprot:8571492-Karenia_brevis.AAC.1
MSGVLCALHNSMGKTAPASFGELKGTYMALPKAFGLTDKPIPERQQVLSIIWGVCVAHRDLVRCGALGPIIPGRQSGATPFPECDATMGPVS